MIRYGFAFYLFFLPACLFAQKGVWQPVQQQAQAFSGQEVWIQPEGAQHVVLNDAVLRPVLDRVEMEVQGDVQRRAPVEITIPNPAGGEDRFHIVETQVMHPDLPWGGGR